RRADPNLGTAFDDGQHLLDRVQMRWSPEARVAELVDDRELRGTTDGGDEHDRGHARPPFLARLGCVIDDLHRFSPCLFANQAECDVTPPRRRLAPQDSRTAAPRTERQY